MDPTLKRFTDGEPGDLTLRFTFLIDGVIVIGGISHPARMEKILTEVLEGVAAQSEDEDAAILRGYTFREPKDKHPDADDYLTLTKVALVFGTGQDLTVPVMRVRTDRITAWWPVTDPPRGDEQDEDEGVELEEAPFSFGVD